jgi:hypothetical protein
VTVLRRKQTRRRAAAGCDAAQSLFALNRVVVFACTPVLENVAS